MMNTDNQMKLEERIVLSVLALNFFFSFPMSQLLIWVPSRESSSSMSSLSQRYYISFCTFIQDQSYSYRLSYLEMLSAFAQSLLQSKSSCQYFQDYCFFSRLILSMIWIRFCYLWPDCSLYCYNLVFYLVSTSIFFSSCSTFSLSNFTSSSVALYFCSQLFSMLILWNWKFVQTNESSMMVKISKSSLMIDDCDALPAYLALISLMPQKPLSLRLALAAFKNYQVWIVRLREEAI